MMKSFALNSYLFGSNAPYVEELYEAYLDNPGSVSDKWRAYFDSLQLVPAADGNPDARDQAHAPSSSRLPNGPNTTSFFPGSPSATFLLPESRSMSSRSLRPIATWATSGPT